MSENPALGELAMLDDYYTHNLPIISYGSQNSSIDGYIAYINKIPLLTEEQELDYARRLHQDGDLKAAHCLIMANLRYVVKVARNYLGYGLPLADLIQEGAVGLMKAVRKFDYTKNIRLVTFAVHWIKAEIHEFILKNWRIVKIATTKAQRKLFFKLRSSKKTFNWLSRQEVQAIATDLKVKPKDVRQMELRIYNNDNSFDEPEQNRFENSEKSLIPANYLEDRNFAPETSLDGLDRDNLVKKLRGAISKLSDRHQDILKRRWLNDVNKDKLQDLAKEYGLSKERIRQIENQAITELRKEFNEYF